MAGGFGAQLFEALLFGPLLSMAGRKKLASFAATPGSKDLLAMNELLEAGKVVPMIDRCYPLSETADAIRYLEDGHARGKVVITVAQGSQSKAQPGQRSTTATDQDHSGRGAAHDRYGEAVMHAG